VVCEGGYEAPTQHRTLDAATTLIRSIVRDRAKGVCPHYHWVSERAWRDGRFIEIQTHHIESEAK
jgi:hypothetical protein